jgi:hypothetical protein
VTVCQSSIVTMGGPSSITKEAQKQKKKLSAQVDDDSARVSAQDSDEWGTEIVGGLFVAIFVVANS